MDSVVLELQKEITKSDCDIVSALRRAHIVASKLGLKDFDQWIVNELNGYKSQDDIPEYRTVPGQLKAFNPYNGWILVSLSEPSIEDIICHPKLDNSISEILSLCNGDGHNIVITLSAEIQKTLNDMSDAPIHMQMAIHVSKTAAADIVEKVKNTLLEWTLELEAKGIIGKGMSFSEQEREIAKSLPPQVNINYGSTNIINGSIEKLQANAGGSINAYFDLEQVKSGIDEIEDSINTSDELSQEDKNEAIELLTDIKKKIEGNKKDTVIKAALVGLKDFLINVGAELTVAMIQAKMPGLF